MTPAQQFAAAEQPDDASADDDDAFAHTGSRCGMLHLRGPAKVGAFKGDRP